MTDPTPYTPPKVWTWNKDSGGRFANINRPIAGADARQGAAGRPAPAAALFAGHAQRREGHGDARGAAGARATRGAEYDAWLIRISEGDQFGSGFVAVNPNSKIPALLDRSGPTPMRVFESGAILLYLAEKFGAFLPTDPARPAPNACRGCSGRWAARPTSAAASATSTPTRRRRSSTRSTASRWRSSASSTCSTATWPRASTWPGDDYTIADMAIWPWYGALVKGLLYDAGEFLQVQDYTNVQRWTDQIAARPAVKRGRMVNRAWGDPASQLHERHDASDFDVQASDSAPAAD